MKKEIIQFIVSMCELKAGKVNSMRVIIRTNDGETLEKFVEVKSK